MKLFKHYRNGRTYELIDEDVLHTETKEVLAVYQDVETKKRYARPREMFFGTVEHTLAPMDTVETPPTLTLQRFEEVLVPTDVECFYFGWREGGGHFLHDVRGHTVWDGRPGWIIPWQHVDGTLLRPPGAKHWENPMPQVEGAAQLHHKDGWTAVAFWDRSGDQRHASNTAFFVKGLWGFEQVMEVARLRFPAVMRRIDAKFTVTLERVP